MRLYGIRVGPESKDWGLYKRRDRDADTERRRPPEDGAEIAGAAGRWERQKCE